MKHILTLIMAILALTSFANASVTDSIDCEISLQHIIENSRRMNADQAANYKRTCPGCGWRYYTRCQNPDCPLKKKNK